jgi:hypothetical protein
LAAGAEQPGGLGLRRHEVTEADPARRRCAQRHQARWPERLLGDLAEHDGQEPRRSRIIEHVHWVLAVIVILVTVGLAHQLGARARADHAERVHTAGKIAHPNAAWCMYAPARRVDHRIFGRAAISLAYRVDRRLHVDEAVKFVRSQENGHAIFRELDVRDYS